MTEQDVPYLEQDYLLDLILQGLQELIDYELAVVLSLRDGEQLEVEKASGPLSSDRIASHRISLKNRRDIARLLDSREPYIFAEDEEHEDTYADLLDLPEGHSCMIIPLYLEETPIGMMTLDHRACGMFSPGLLRFIKTLSRLIAIILVQNRSSRRLRERARLLTEERNLLLTRDAEPFRRVIGKSGPWQHVLESVRIVAGSEASVLLQGETGTGKEEIARLIHNLSPRRDNPFIALNCSALTTSLAESELFGHEKGAFTSAHQQRKGRFELAEGGTLFLDEIGDLPAEIQPKLLRALQEGTFQRVGGEKEIRINLRIIAASHVDLKQATRDKRFRDDLYYRLTVFPISLPPLRERREDILLLADHFLQELRAEKGGRIPRLTDGAAGLLQGHPWPGNVRELRNTLYRAVLVAESDLINESQLRSVLSAAPGAEGRPEGTTAPLLPLDEAVRRHIRKALEHSGGRIYGEAGAAALLGLKPTTLQSRMKKLGLR